MQLNNNHTFSQFIIKIIYEWIKKNTKDNRLLSFRQNIRSVTERFFIDVMISLCR